MAGDGKTKTNGEVERSGNPRKRPRWRSQVRVFSSLRVRLLLVVFAAFVPTWLTLIHEVGVRRQEALQRILADSLNAAELAAVREEQIIEATMQTLRTMARAVSSSPAGCEVLADLARDAMASSDRYLHFGLVSSAGRVLCRVVKEADAGVVSHKMWIRRNGTGSRLSIFYYRTPAVHRPALLVAVPLGPDSDAPGAFLFASIDISRLTRSSLPGKWAQDPATVFALVDESGALAGRTPGQRDLADALNRTMTDLGGGDEAAVRVVRDPSGKSWVCSRAPIHGRSQNTALGVLLAVPKDRAFRDVDAARTRGFLVILVVTVLALVIAWIMGGRVLWTPLTHLVDATGRIASGDLTVRSGMAQRRDELGLLARAFDAMAAALEKREQDHLSAQEAIRQSEQRLRRLGIHLQQIREEEQKRLAMEIHDDIGQILTALRFDLSWIRKHTPAEDPEKIQERIARMFSLLDSGMESVHRLCGQLRPRILDDLGLAEAIRWQAEEFAKRTGIDCDTRQVDSANLPAEHALALFRIFQESLTNVARHAGARRVEVGLTVEAHEARLAVRDDGRGIDPEAAGSPGAFGLMSMRERAAALGGSFCADRHPDGGTVVEARLPLPATASRETHTTEENGT